MANRGNKGLITTKALRSYLLGVIFTVALLFLSEKETEAVYVWPMKQTPFWLI